VMLTMDNGAAFWAMFPTSCRKKSATRILQLAPYFLGQRRHEALHDKALIYASGEKEVRALQSG